MKSIRRLFRIVAVATILSLLVVALPATPALAAEDIDLSPNEGEIGEYIDIDGQDFTFSAYIDIYFTSEEVDRGDDLDDLDYYELVKEYTTEDDGDFDTRIRVPDRLEDGDDEEDVHGGDYYVFVTYEDDDYIEAVDTFTVIAGEIELDDDEGVVGTEVEIDGTGFAANEDIEVFLDDEDDEVSIKSGDKDTDSDGEFTCKIIIPESTAGTHTIIVTDESGSEAEAEFTVEPEITFTPTKGAAGDKVTVKGTGFGDEVDVSIKLDGDEVKTDETDDYGSFQLIFTVPVKSRGTYDVEAEDDDNNKAEEEFAIAAGAKLSPTTGNVGSEVTISGSGFSPNATATITYAPESTPVATRTTDDNGKFSATFTIPQSKYGNHIITVSDGTNTETTSFTMESEAPPIPQPELPFDGDKAKSLASFDWGDVDDPSLPVTYTLQIATDEEFTDIVLEQPGLTKSEYTLAKDEKLESTKKEAPYYWRVRAVDGADNNSQWSGVGSFYVGFTFGLTGGILYTLMGIAGLFLLLVGYLLGRRTAYA